MFGPCGHEDSETGVPLCQIPERPTHGLSLTDTEQRLAIVERKVFDDIEPWMANFGIDKAVEAFLWGENGEEARRGKGVSTQHSFRDSNGGLTQSKDYTLDDVMNILHQKHLEQKAGLERLLETSLENHMSKLSQALIAMGAQLETLLDLKLQPHSARNSILISEADLSEKAPCRRDTRKVSHVTRAALPSVYGRARGSESDTIGPATQSTPSSATVLRERLEPEKEAKEIGRESKARKSLLSAMNFAFHTADRTSTSRARTGSLVVVRGQKDTFIPTTPFQNLMSTFVHTVPFATFSGVLIISNAAMIAIQLDIDLRRAIRGEDELAWETTSDVVFTCLFTIELLLRVVTEQSFFFFGPSNKWNLFDLFIVTTGIVEVIDVVDASLTYLSVLRIVRVLRVLRVIRVFRIFRELRMMALSILSCFTSLVWAFCLLLLVLFIFAMVLLEGGRQYVRGKDVDPDVTEGLVKNYFGVISTIFTLIKAVSSGNSWGDVARPFVDISWFYGVMFVAFIIFVMFGLLNVLVGVFVQNTEAIANIDKEFVIQEQMTRKDSLVNQMKSLFHEIDVDGSGTISWREMSAHLKDDAMLAYFSMMDIEINEAINLFKLLDLDDSGEVGIDEFIVGCMRLKGTARSIDMAALLHDNKRLHTVLRRFMNHVSCELRQIRQLNARNTVGGIGLDSETTQSKRTSLQEDLSNSVWMCSSQIHQASASSKSTKPNKSVGAAPNAL